MTESSIPIVPPPTSKSELRALGLALLLLVLGDFLFWPAAPGVSLACFAAASLLALALQHRTALFRGKTWLALPLFAASLVATVWQISFSNVLVLLLLLCILVGETSYPALATGWARWSEAAFAFFKAPLRWLWLRRALANLPLNPESWGQDASRLVRIIFLPFLVGGAFFLLFISGNAILHQWSAQWLDAITRWLSSFDLTVGRFFFWGMLGSFSLALLRPAFASTRGRFWVRQLPRATTAAEPHVAWWRSLLLLALLNALFFVENTTDALYLWNHFALPQGVSFSSYVHEGVNSLIVAVLLSALVLALVFQQASEVSATRWLKGLGLLWIVQNGILIASVILRLKRYVDAYQLTEERLGVVIFLALVLAGFGLLATYILREKSFTWLLFGNATAVFLLFFILQFMDTARWVAEYNVTCWQRDPRHALDLNYLESLGSSAWPSLITVAQLRNRPESDDAARRLTKIEGDENTVEASRNWRSWQWHEAANLGELFGDWEKTIY
ncbi:MAG: DUF4173 domain-containing protein [Chthoniobacteraceae bacterium]